MKKNDYMKPTMKAMGSCLDEEMLAGSVATIGLDDSEKLEMDDGIPKDAWETAW